MRVTYMSLVWTNSVTYMLVRPMFQDSLVSIVTGIVSILEVSNGGGLQKHSISSCFIVKEHRRPLCILMTDSLVTDLSYACTGLTSNGIAQENVG